MPKTSPDNVEADFTTSIRVPKQTWLALRLHAFLEGITVSEALDQAIRQYLGADLLLEAARLAARSKITGKKPRR